MTDAPDRGACLASDVAIDSLQFDPVQQGDAEAIAAWHYPGVYAFYDFAADAEDLAELLDPEQRAGTYFAARSAGSELVGFVAVTAAGDDGVEIGLGLRPDCTGRGLGEPFVLTVCAWVAEHWKPLQLVLRVATFNARAISVYERAGFSARATELIATNGAEVPFVRMERAATV